MKTLKHIFPVFLCLLVSVSSSVTAAQASPNRLTMTVRQTPSVSDPVITLYGQIHPARNGQRVDIQVQIKNSWKSTLFSTKTTRSGTWKVEAVATALNSTVNYRAVAYVNEKRVYSPARSLTIKRLPVSSTPTPASLLIEQGPGGRIHGMDISKWQHPNDAPIDFVKMYNAGIRFVMIKSSDSHDNYDAQALKYLTMDHNAAQAAGIYTGYYYYATLPDSSDTATIVRDALAQAQKAIWRLASIGGYTNRDLPYALDLENNCVRVLISGSCAKYTSRNAVTLWATTWLSTVAAKTGRPPILYSYPQFLENAMTRSSELSKYPLWIAHYSLNAFDPLSQPGLKTSGCFVTPWTTANCSSLWTVWQYTSCGIASKYGVPGTRVDLNVFRGTPEAFLNLAKGTWVPESTDMMPVQEPSVTIIKSTIADTSNKPVTFMVDVNRPTGLPVVTGTVSFAFDPTTTPIPPISQSAVRSSSGSWTLSVKGIPAGTWSGTVTFKDVSGTHATSFAPVQFAVTAGPTPTPTPTSSPKPTPTPTKSPKPTPKPSVDACQNQIRY